MTLTEINRIADLMAAAGRRNVPVPISEWRILEMLKIPATEITIDSDFALLDVKKGRKRLAKKMPSGAGVLKADERIPIVIHGFISHQASNDDGVSIEFAVDVEKVVIMPSKSIGKVSAKALAKGKVKPVDKTPAPLAKGKHAKAARIEKGLKANRARVKK